MPVEGVKRDRVPKKKSRTNYKFNLYIGMTNMIQAATVNTTQLHINIMHIINYERQKKSSEVGHVRV